MGKRVSWDMTYGTAVYHHSRVMPTHAAVERLLNNLYSMPNVSNVRVSE